MKMIFYLEIQSRAKSEKNVCVNKEILDVVF